MISILQIEDFITNTKIGVSEEEKKIKQPISWDVIVRFEEVCVGAISDDIRETLSYDDICSKLKEISSANYNLIEKLCLTGYQEIKKLLNPSDYLSVKVSKTKPPIENFKGAASFIIED